MSYNTKNYREQGGEVTVIGGEVKLLEGARVSGSLTLPIENQAASTATTVSALKDDFNALLSKLKEAGIMAPDEEADLEPENDPEENPGNE